MINRKCEKGHEWISSDSDARRGRGCPYCGGRRVCKDNSFSENYPELAKEWNYARNKYAPTDYVCFSGEKVWWQCKSCLYEWQSKIGYRVKYSKCPNCIGRVVNFENNVAAQYPHLSLEWDIEKNQNKPLCDYLQANNQKFWWKCKKGHSFCQSISKRTFRNQGCPYCSNTRVCLDNCLATINPELAKEWHPTKNNNLTAMQVVPSSGKKVWWKCEKGHEWENNVCARHNGRGCPYCSNSKACSDNCLATINPELAKEWHPIKNGIKTPKDFLPNSKDKVWWLCPNGHEYEAKIYHRNTTSSCPLCSQGIVLKDGEFCHSVVEAFIYLKLKAQGVNFIHNGTYGLGRKRYDFFITDENKYIEVTSFFKTSSPKQRAFYISYLRNIVEKKRYVENVLGAKFEFLQIKMKISDTKAVRQAAMQFAVRKRCKTRLFFPLRDVESA